MTSFLNNGKLLTNDGFCREGRNSPVLQGRRRIGGIVYKLADCRLEREAAFHLIYSGYLSSGLIRPNRHGMRVTPCHLLPSTDLFIAMDQGVLICTMTLVGDGALGLPLEEVYSPEVTALRKRRISLGEVSCLASKQGHFSQRRMFRVFLQLVGLMFQTARARGIGRALIAVHPRHVKMYEKMLGFEQLGDERTYSSVCGNPSIACQHDFASLEEVGYRAYDQVYGTTFSHLELARRPMTPEDLAYFAAVARECQTSLPAAA